MTLDSEIGLFANRGKLIDGQADIDLNDAMALGTGQVVVMRTTTYAVMVRAVGKLNAVQ